MNCFYIYLLLLSVVALDDRAAYNPTFSSSFKIVSDDFKLSYIDGTKLTGYICSDYIAIGDYSAYMNFGCMLPQSGPVPNMQQDFSGILGFGFPATDSKTKYTNVLQSIMSNNYNANNIFTLVLDAQKSRGELQIGGVDLANHAVDISQSIVADILHDCDHDHKCVYRHYRIAIDHVRVGRHTIFTSNGNNARSRVSAVVDSGTTCIILPSKAGGERVYTDIYASFVDVLQHFNYARDQPSLYFGISGKEIEVTYQDYMLMNSLSRSAAVDPAPPPMCVLTLPHYPQLFVLGDIFLQNLVTVHNLTGTPSLLFIPKVSREKSRVQSEALRNVSSTAANSLSLFPLPLFTLPLHRKAGQDMRSKLHSMAMRRADVSVVPLEAVEGIQYVSFIAAGMPVQQNISVIVDTGSASLALITIGLEKDSHDAPGKSSRHYIIVSMLILIGGVIVGLYKIFQRSLKYNTGDGNWNSLDSTKAYLYSVLWETADDRRDADDDIL